LIPDRQKNPELKNIKDFADKYIAHSASDESRKELGAEVQLRAADIKKVVQDLTEAFFCCDMLVSQVDHAGMIAIGWQRRLGNLTKHEAGIVNAVFDSIDKECQQWRQTGQGLLGL
jgi:hypothetical protein